MKLFSILALGVVGLCAAPRVDAAVQFGRGNDRARGDQVCVYKDINFVGAEQCYNAGEQINDLGSQRKSISSIRVYGRATVTVFESTAFRGRSEQFTADVSDLGRRMMSGNTSWSDHIDSLQIGGGSVFNTGNRGNGQARGDVCVYKDINYQGAEQCYNAGDEINDLGAQRKSISSIRVSGRSTVTVFENTGFRGRSDAFTSDVPDLGRRMMSGNTSWSDHIDSLQIGGSSGSNAGNRGPGDFRRNEPRDGVCVYDRPNYEGRSECWNEGENIADLGTQDNWSERISSIRIFGRAIAVVYQDPGYRGESLTVDSDIPDMAAIRARGNGNGIGRGRGNRKNSGDWTNEISSIQVQAPRRNR